MIRIKSLLCIALLSTCFVGNVFAGSTFSYGVTTFFGNVVEFFVGVYEDGDDCPLRICQNCKPNTICRPIDD